MVLGGSAELRTLVYILFSNIVGFLVCRSFETRERELFLQRRRAEEAHAEKSRLLAAVSHDLRQPMAAMNSYVALLDRAINRNEEAKARRQIGHIRESVKMLSATLDQLMVAAMYDSGKVKHQVEMLEIGPLIGELRRSYFDEARKKGIELRVRIPNYRILVKSDEAVLRRILMNLISNAVKFTPAVAADGRVLKGRGVLVAVRLFGQTCRIDVVDTGIGIAPEDRARIWQPYFQVESGERDRASGIGLGLHIVEKQLALLTTHRIHLSSRPGRGSRFTLRLPGERLRVSGVVERAVEQAGEAEMQILAGAYVVVLEDDVDARRAITELLDDWGVLHVSSARLEDLQEELASGLRSPDAVISDFRLPGGRTGAACIEEIRRILGDRIPAVLVTGEADLIAVAAQLPPDTVLLHKPFSEAQLAQPLLDAVHRARRAETAES